MAGTASVLLTMDIIFHLVNHRDHEVEIHDVTFFGDDLFQVYLGHPRLPDGYNGQNELFFKPWPRGEIHFRREADT